MLPVVLFGHLLRSANKTLRDYRRTAGVFASKTGLSFVYIRLAPVISLGGRDRLALGAVLWLPCFPAWPRSLQGLYFRFNPVRLDCFES